VVTYRLSSWTAFPRFIEQEFLDFRSFVFRGQCAAKWPLESTLDRLLRQPGAPTGPAVRERHLDTFKYATRGRRGAQPPQLGTENDWWALGQHFGLATPLLDWTTSPYVAAYFAFASEPNDGDAYRAVWALDRYLITARSADIGKAATPPARPPVVEFVRPFSDENSRLVSQGGLFTRAPDGVDVEAWVKANFEDATPDVVLAKIEIPNGDRHLCLRSLNRMNINHLSLFPDLFGASRYCNFDLMIKYY
jgi:hypothetical protein